jgi:LysM repeat protein
MIGGNWLCCATLTGEFMRSRLSRAALPFSAALLLLTAGCFRQAGEGIEPTASGAAPIAVTRDLTVDSAANPPAESTPVTELVSETQMPTAPVAVMDISAATPAPVEAAPTVALVIVTSTPQFVTPQLPLGFIITDTPAPTVASILDTSGLTATLAQPSFILPNSSDLLPTPTNLPGIDDECIHIVQPGNTLYAIALNYGLTVSDLVTANPDLGDSSAVLQPGDPLALPLPECLGAEATDEAGNPLPTRTPLPPTAPPAPTPTSPDGTQRYVVQSGDVLVNIATRFGVTVSAIVRANNLSNPNALQVGQELIIPAAN